MASAIASLNLDAWKGQKGKTDGCRKWQPITIWGIKLPRIEVESSGRLPYEVTSFPERELEGESNRFQNVSESCMFQNHVSCLGVAVRTGCAECGVGVQRESFGCPTADLPGVVYM